jgi:glyoxylase-like metal-dependent hydrolase (beta-lactamase superfamily II)
MHDWPQHMTFLQRGWLSSNHLLLTGADETVLIDSGYASHADQTLALVQHALNGRPLDRLVNTHLHSDHCGGNARLQAAYPALQTQIAPGLADAVTHWDESRLTYAPTGQDCPRFAFDGLMRPGDEVNMGGHVWQIHAAPGHDPHSIILFEPSSSVLVSADALWENGFGVVFPEIEGEDGFSGIAQTLDLIESLQARWVVPGHGPVFQDVAAALVRARARLNGFLSAPIKHASHAAKVLLKFKLLDWQHIETDAMMQWAQHCRFLCLLHQRYFDRLGLHDWIESLMWDLVQAQVAQQDGTVWVNVN